MNNRTRIPRNVIMLGVVSLLTDASSEMIYPLIPVFVAALGSGAVILGVIEGAAETTAAILKLFSGIISDKFGKRKVLVVAGYSISSIARPFTGVVSSAWEIIFIRMLDRVGKGIRTAPRDALIAASVDERIRGRAYGFHRSMDHLGAVAGPLLALCSLVVLVAVLGFHDVLRTLRWTFLLAVIPGILAVATAAFFVHEQNDAVPALKTFRLSPGQFGANFLRYIAVTALFTLGNSSDAFLLFRVEEAIQRSGSLYAAVVGLPLLGEAVGRFGDSSAQKQIVDILFLPLLWAFFHILKAASSTPLGALSDRIGRKTVIGTGWGIYAFVYVCFGFLDRVPAGLQVPLTFVLFAVYSLYYAFTEGVEKAFVADLVAPEVRGSAFGLYNFAVGLGALPASIIFGLLYNSFGGGTAFFFGASAALAAIIALSLGVHERSSGSGT